MDEQLDVRLMTQEQILAPPTRTKSPTDRVQPGPLERAGQAAPDWGRFRAQMPVARHWAYFDHAAVAPLSGPARDALSAWARDVAENGDIHWPVWAARLEQVRRQGAALLGAQLDELALIRNTTEGIGLVAEGFPWQAGDNVVLLDDEFPSNRIPWQHLDSRGVETRLVRSTGTDEDLARLAAACDARTRIVSVSWVGYSSGRRFDVAELASVVHGKGALLFLDAIQGLGVFPLDVREAGVDFLAADGHKWLLGPEGAGFFYVRSEHLDRLRPLGVGWNSVVDSAKFSHEERRLKPSAARYEGGTPNMAGFVALGASLALLARYGTKALSKRILHLTDVACEQLRRSGAVVHGDRSPERASGIVSFELSGKNPMAVRKKLAELGVALSCRNGKLRISPHAYNDDDDIGRLMATIASLS
jgi:selenocysteine lyase/cysteine desulfurase